MARASTSTVIVIGAGPAGLFAAELLARAGCGVRVIERMPSPVRKFLMAGRGGLNLTHGEPLETFARRYRAGNPRVASWLARFGPADLVAWCEGLGEPTFVGSSGRVFPKSLKASPLTRAWLRRLAGLGVKFSLKTRWLGWDDQGRLLLEGPGGLDHARPDATLLALGGASWPRLGSDGAWTRLLAARAVALAPLVPANMGIEIPWSAHMRERHAGEPLKRVALAVGDIAAKGDAVITDYGLEGGAVYGVSGVIRDALASGASATLRLDLRPDIAVEALADRLGRPRGRQSLANHLRKTAKLSGAAIALLRESRLPRSTLPEDPAALAGLIKASPLRPSGVRGLDRAISSAGGIALDALDDHLMVKASPGVFAAGEMLDWDGPTGGYLLQACFSSAYVAAKGVLAWLGQGSVSNEI